MFTFDFQNPIKTNKLNALIQKLPSSIFIIFIFSVLFAKAQSVGIGTNSPNANAILELKSSTKGLLMPKMDSVTRKTMPNIKALTVYDTTSNCLWYNNGNNWVNIDPKGNVVGDMLFWNGREWATIGAGTAGQTLSLSNALKPTWVNGGSTTTAAAVGTVSLSNITSTSAIGGGNVLSDGGAAITARRVVWSTTSTPTIALSTKTTDGSGTGFYSSNITGLQPNTTYYIRAYATNTSGTVYGNQLVFTTLISSTYTLGQSFGGGIIFYIDATGQHGLIAATVDASANAIWSAASSITGATGIATGTGSANTNSIVSALGTGIYAASLCKLYFNSGGYTDWYLPSIMELNLLFNQRGLVPGLYYSGTNNPPSVLYWSSSEVNADDAYASDFLATSPTQYSISKTNSSTFGYTSVRPIRAF
jgi:hypothetical protein